jgi:hypothetical protein
VQCCTIITILKFASVTSYYHAMTFWNSITFWKNHFLWAQMCTISLNSFLYFLITIVKPVKIFLESFNTKEHVRGQPRQCWELEWMNLRHWWYYQLHMWEVGQGNTSGVAAHVWCGSCESSVCLCLLDYQATHGTCGNFLFMFSSCGCTVRGHPFLTPHIQLRSWLCNSDSVCADHSVEFLVPYRIPSLTICRAIRASGHRPE